MTFLAEIGTACNQERLVHRAVGPMTQRTIFARRWMIKEVRTPQFCMTAQTRVVQRHAHELPARHAAVRVVAIAAEYLGFANGMTTGQIRLGAHVGMTVIADSRLVLG